MAYHGLDSRCVCVCLRASTIFVRCYCASHHLAFGVLCNFTLKFINRKMSIEHIAIRHQRYSDDRHIFVFLEKNAFSRNVCIFPCCSLSLFAGIENKRNAKQSPFYIWFASWSSWPFILQNVPHNRSFWVTGTRRALHNSNMSLAKKKYSDFADNVAMLRNQKNIFAENGLTTGVRNSRHDLTFTSSCVITWI